MEWQCFFAISAYILTVCDPVLCDNTIINVRLVDGRTPNEGRVEYLLSEASTWEPACGDLRFSPMVTSVICRQLGYPGVNNLFTQWSFGTSTSLAQHQVSCTINVNNLANCSLVRTPSPCIDKGGVICYESGYIGCYPSMLGELQTPCENGVEDLTIPQCVSLCHHTDDTYAYAGLYQGNICYCWSASTTARAMDRVEDGMCSSSCAGRDIEKCGGDSKIALFDITLYLQNFNRTVSIPECAEPTPTPTEGDETTTVRIQSSSSTSSSLPPTSPPSTGRTTMEGAVSSTVVTSSSSSDHTTESTTAQTTTEGMKSTANVQTYQTSPVMISDMTPRSRTPTGRPARTTRGRTTQAGVPSNLGLYIGVGAGGGILLIVIVILFLVVSLIRRRWSKDKSSSSDHNILELRLRPEGSDLGVFPPLPFSPNNYSLENGHTNMADDDLSTTGLEDSDYALIADTDMNPAKSARNSSTYEDVPRLESTSGSRRPPQPAPRKSAKDTQFTMHPVHELYTTPDESQLSNGYRDYIPDYAVSQKFRRESINQAVPQAPPSALGPEDINGLYTMPDKSRNMTKAKILLDSDMDRPAGIDNALYICRGENDLRVRETPNKYATDRDGVEAGGKHESDGNTGMVENDLYETSHRPTGGNTGMVENDLYETSHRPTGGDTGMVENDLYDTSYRPT